MVEHNLPHLVALFQDLELKIQDLGTFLSHAHNVHGELKDIWQEIIQEPQDPSERD